MITVLLTDGEFTGMIHALRERADVRIVGFLFSENAAHRTMLDRFYVAPSWDDPRYVSFLYEVIEKEKVDVIFPVVTKSLELMASLSSEIREKTGAFVVTSPASVISIANNKASLFQHLSENASTAEYVTDYQVVTALGELREKAEVPCVIKPVIGENKEGFLRFVSDEEWKETFLHGRSGRVVCPSLLKDLSGEDVFSEPRLVMPYLPGQEWDADLLILDGKIVSATIRKNLDMFDGLSAITETSEDPRILSACEKIVAALGLQYLCCISFKETENGELKLLEINPRAMGSIYVSALGKNNLVLRLLDDLFSEKCDRPFHLTSGGLTTSLYYDIVAIPKGENE